MTGFFGHPGTPAGDLPEIAAGIMRLAARGPAESAGEEAARLAQMTLSSVSDWKAALHIIGRHPQREKLIIITGQMVMTGFTSAHYAAASVMHIIGGERGDDVPEPPVLLRSALTPEVEDTPTPGTSPPQRPGPR